MNSLVIPPPTNRKGRLLTALAAALLTLSAVPQTVAQMANLYVGIDSRQILPSGLYAGLPNPNANRLTLLYAHHYPYGQFQGNHYHGIGTYSYTGPANEPVTMDTSGGNQIPEFYTELPGITLVPGIGESWLGKLVSRKHAEHYSDFRLRSVHSLAPFGFGSSEWYMFRSSANTRTNPMTDATIALELVSKSEAIQIADSDGNPILATPGATQVIGDGNDPDFEYLPIFWVDPSTEPGTYTAELRLVDINTTDGRTPFPPSGRFTFVFSVPEPASLILTRTITLTMPLVTDGYVLEAAPSPDGPWTSIPFPPGENTLHTQTEITKDLTLPVTAQRAFYRLRRLE